MPIDEEIINRVHPEEPTELEREWMDKIGVDEFSVYLTKLELICEEAKQNMVMTGLSAGIQGMDCAVGLYTAAGDLVAASVGTYLHICTGQVPIKYTPIPFSPALEKAWMPDENDLIQAVSELTD